MLNALPPPVEMQVDHPSSANEASSEEESEARYRTRICESKNYSFAIPLY